MDERGDAIVVVAPVAEDGVWTTQFVAGGGYSGRSWRSIRERGWDFDMTVSALIVELGKTGPTERVVVPTLAQV